LVLHSETPTLELCGEASSREQPQGEVGEPGLGGHLPEGGAVRRRDSQDSLEAVADLPTDQRTDYSRPGFLAGSVVSETTGSRSSLISEGEVSFAGHINDRLGRLLGYVAAQAEAGMNVEGAMASITGYEVLSHGKEKYTVFKIKVSLPDSVPGAWFIHRRYSDFLCLRATLLKESPGLGPRLPFPPKRWVGSNLEPAFLGRRLAGLQVFLASVLEDSSLRGSPALASFLCLDQRPPVGGNGLEANRAVCDTLEEAVKELREQLRKREQLETELDFMRNQNVVKDSQITHLEKENDLLRQQKMSLMTALSSSSAPLNTSLQSRRDKRSTKGPGPRIDSLEDFTAKFGLRPGEGPGARSTPTKESSNILSPNKECSSTVKMRSKQIREESLERRKSSIQ